MYVLSIIPLSKTAPPEPLSYRSSVNLPPGALVNISLRRSDITGVVVDSIPVREAKAELKSASFSVLKSASARAGSLPDAYVTAALRVAEFHATTFGAVLSSLFVPVQRTIGEALHVADGSVHEVQTVESPTTIRMEAYRSIIKNAAEHTKGAVLLVVPTEIEARMYAQTFKKFSPLVLSGSVSEKKREALFAAAAISTSLVITTPSFSWIPIEKLSAIIIERMSAGGYQLPKRPYIDVRYALTELAKERKIPITYGDYPLPIEYRLDPAVSLTTGPISEIELFDARASQEESGRWSAMPSALTGAITDIRAENGVTAILTVRRGYAPVVVCHDCGTTVTDEHGRTLSVATENGERVLRSADGTSVQSALQFCKNCNSWDLVPLGVGSERIEEELRKNFPDALIVRADQDLTPAKLKAAIKSAIETPGAIIVGTELMLPLLSTSEPLALGIVASADSLLALPFWRARERFIRVGLMLAERTEHTIISTRHADDSALTALLSPTVSTFWQEESGMRKILSYPPYGTLVVLQSEGSRDRVLASQELITALCTPHAVTHMPLRSLSATSMRGTSILQLVDGAWPDAELAANLASLPPYVKIHVNAETLW